MILGSTNKSVLTPLSESSRRESIESSTHAAYRMTFAGSKMLGLQPAQELNMSLRRSPDASRSEQVGIILPYDTRASNQFIVNAPLSAEKKSQPG